MTSLLRRWRRKCVKGSLNVYYEPKASSGVVARLPAGTGGIYIVDCKASGKWCLISVGANGSLGWARSRNLGGYAD